MPSPKSSVAYASLHTGAVELHYGRQEDFDRQLALAEDFLASREQWPGGPVGLPAARLVDTSARRLA